MTNTQTDDEIKVMFHAQLDSTCNLRCIYRVHQAIGSKVCQSLYIAGTPEFEQAYNAARASGVLVAATEAVF
mgnify:FL=1